MPRPCGGSGCAAAPNATPWRPVAHPTAPAPGRCSPPTLLDAAWHLFRAVAGPPPTPAAPRPARAPPRVTRLDLATPAQPTVPLLPEPLCPCCVPAEVPTGRGRPDRRPSAPNRAPPATGCAPRDYYRLPDGALANPVCGALGAGHAGSTRPSPTTAPVAGSDFVRGYAGLHDVTWSGQADRLRRPAATSPSSEGLERYAGTHRRRGTGPCGAPPTSTLADRALDPADCGVYAAETYDRRPAACSRFDPDRAIPLGVGPLAARRAARSWCPARLRYYSAGAPADNFVFECSNGCATGSCLEEAVAVRAAGADRARRVPARLVRRRRPPRSTSALPPCPASGRCWTGPRCTATTCTPSTTAVDLPVPVVTGARGTARRRPGHAVLRGGRAPRPGAARSRPHCRGAHLHPAPARPGRRRRHELRGDGRRLRPGYGPARTTRSSTACRGWRARRALPAPAAGRSRDVRASWAAGAAAHRRPAGRPAAAGPAGGGGLRRDRGRPDHARAAPMGLRTVSTPSRAAADRLRLAGSAPCRCRGCGPGCGGRPAHR